jgi:CheY-like chemotaxis protein
MKSSWFPPRDPIRVLVIDDDDIARMAMVDLLASAGYQVSDLPSPIGATQKLLHDQIDVVVLDVMMPSLRGDKLATLLRKNPRLQHLGVILVTGALPDELQEVAGQVEAHAVIEKARIDEALVDAVNRAARASLELRS